MRGSSTRHPIRTLAATMIVAALATTMLAPSAGATSTATAKEHRVKAERRAKSQRGAPYRTGGTTPNGFDCSGFTLWVFKKFGIKLPHQSESQFNLGKKSNYRRVWKRKALKPGDLVFHKTSSAKVGHAGMYIGGGRFISSTSSSGVRVDSLYDSYWGPRWVGGTRLPYTRAG